MKNENFVNSDIENILKTKMNELSDSVDCFDKISARAFPQEKQDFSEDDGYTVSDLENITGKTNKFRLMRWTAVAASVAVCIAVIPKTDFGRRIFANLSMGSVKKSYQNIITEINRELDTGNYISFDVPFEHYAENDVLVTPLFPCPFEDCGKENAVVRLYIKQYEGYNTTQMYAVLYADTYSENNIIAAAVSNFRFSENELSDIINEDKIVENQALLADESLAEVNFRFVCTEDGSIQDKDGNTVSLASFQHTVITKTESGAKLVTSNILYGHGDDSNYFYDINTPDSNNDLPEREKMWKKSVYFNGNSAFPKESDSNFTKTVIFDSNDTVNKSEEACEFIYPYNSTKYYNYADIETPIELQLLDSDNDNLMCSALVPSLPEAYITMRMYYSPLIFKLDVYSEQLNLIGLNKAGEEIFKDNMFQQQHDSEAEIKRQEEEIKAEILKQCEEAELLWKEETQRQQELQAMKMTEQERLQLSIEEAEEKSKIEMNKQSLSETE